MPKRKSTYLCITSIYSNFWNLFLETVRKSQLVVDPEYDPFKVIINGTEAKVSLKRPIYLKNWPFKAASGKNNLHIVISATETIDLSDNKIKESGVQVIYYQQKAGKDIIKPIESIHYDYNEFPVFAHPVFHAQFCHDAVDSSQIKQIEILQDYKLITDNFGERFGHLKIPTAHMNIISVLLSLCADHIPIAHSKANLKILFNNVQRIEEMPLVKAEKLTNNINKNNSFCSMHWYIG